MKQFTLNLDILQQRPVITLNNFAALLDTGAYFPVWTDDETILLDEFAAVLRKRDVTFSGFGGVAVGNLYQIMFQLGDLTFSSLPIIANGEMTVPFSMILSATMFQGLIYEIDNRNHKFNVLSRMVKAWCEI